VIALPPVTAGAVHVIFNELPVPVAATAVGAAGATATLGVNAADFAETNEVVPLPEGVTSKTYDVPSVRPLIVHVCVPFGGVVLFATVQVKPDSAVVGAAAV
jgi:hypothetical protein